MAGMFTFIIVFLTVSAATVFVDGLYAFYQPIDTNDFDDWLVDAATAESYNLNVNNNLNFPLQPSQPSYSGDSYELPLFDDDREPASILELKQQSPNESLDNRNGQLVMVKMSGNDGQYELLKTESGKTERLLLGGGGRLLLSDDDDDESLDDGNLKAHHIGRWTAVHILAATASCQFRIFPARRRQ